MNNELLDDLNYINGELPEFVYVGLGKRAVACILDMFVFYFFMILLAGIVLMLEYFFGGEIMDLFYLIIGLTTFLYIPLFEGSIYQGTPGKQIMKIKIIDYDGQRISYGKAIFRTLSKFLSYIIFFIGFIMVAFTDKKQGLHDILVKTYVVEKK